MPRSFAALARSLIVSFCAAALGLGLGLGGGCAEPPAGLAREHVQYGPADDRHEVWEEPAGTHRTIAESAVAMQIGADAVERRGVRDLVVSYTRTLGEAQSLCAGERYADQIEPGTCTGTLIDDRHILTAGHCVEAASDCDGVSYPWLFGFSYESADVLRPLTIDDLYDCTRIVVYQNDDDADFAVIELDRAVVGHTPARLRAISDPPPLGTALTLIGHPNGIPMKIAHGGTVRDLLARDFFGDVDAFSGNSGSGVLDASGEVVGVLVSGADDYVATGSCSVVDVIDPVPDGEGERITGTRVAIDAFCAAPGVSSPVCGTAIDAGMSARDAATAIDAGPALEDASIGSADAGSRRPEPMGSCGCRTAASGNATMVLPSALVLLSMLMVRRRRRRAACRAVGSLPASRVSVEEVVADSARVGCG